MAEENVTYFSAIYDNFFTRVTDVMYFQMNRLDTERDLQDILITSLPKFEFPRFNVFDYEIGTKVETEDPDTGETIVTWDGGFFNTILTLEEINILSLCMMEEWLRRQLATTKLTEQIYTGSDFKLGSQANHMKTLNNMFSATHTDNIHLQRIYRRRIVDRNTGKVRSSLGSIISTPSYGCSIGGIDYDD